MAFGFSGLQYLYVGRWWLFLLQFVAFASLAAVALLLDPNGAIMTHAARFCKADSDATGVKLQIEHFLELLLVLNILIGMFAIKRDGQGGLLADDYKSGWHWLFFLVFGITGAHLGYKFAEQRMPKYEILHLLFVNIPFVLLCTKLEPGNLFGGVVLFVIANIVVYVETAIIHLEFE